MKTALGRVAILGLAALAAGCVGPGAVNVRPGAEVTRFHLGGDPARGEISVEPFDAQVADTLQYGAAAAVVERELFNRGWRVVTGAGRSEQVALVRLEQSTREAVRRRSGLSIGIGGGSYLGGGVGVGAGITLPVGRGGGTGQIVVSELVVRLQSRSGGTAIWEGRAQTEARSGTPEALPLGAADRLTRALFQGFPGESGRTIRVP